MAVKECLYHADMKMDDKKMGLISGNTVGGMEKSELYYKEFLDYKQNEHTSFIDAHDCGACTEKIADYFDCFEFITSISTACSSAANAVAMGTRLIRSGRLDRVVVGGTECLSKFHINGFLSLMILSDIPSTPFDVNRKGINLGEGAAYLLLESEEAIKRRGGVALVEVAGYGNACDAYHQTASSPEGDGAFIAMKEALEMSGLKPSDINYINAHGTGTVNNDASEGKAIERLFGTTPPPVSSTKPFTGHTTSAAGTVEAVISILSMQHSFIPANLYFKEKDPAICFKPVKTTCTDQRLNHVMTNSFGFGGNNTSLIFSKITE
jgi:3-oxoacyl-[acyl-carrier-protein] synthase-1